MTYVMTWLMLLSPCQKIHSCYYGSSVKEITTIFTFITALSTVQRMWHHFSTCLFFPSHHSLLEHSRRMVFSSYHSHCSFIAPLVPNDRSLFWFPSDSPHYGTIADSNNGQRYKESQYKIHNYEGLVAGVIVLPVYGTSSYTGL